MQKIKFKDCDNLQVTFIWDKQMLQKNYREWISSGIKYIQLYIQVHIVSII